MVGKAKIHRMARSKEVEERKKAIQEIRRNFTFLSDREKKRAWENLIWLMQDNNSDVRGRAAYAFGVAFFSIPDKNQAWEELERLTQSKNSNVRKVATEALGVAFFSIPDKKQAWE